LFQGDGQKFKLRLQVGSVSSDLLLYFEEPWVFQRQLSMGFNLFRQTAEYTSTYYREVVAGIEIFARKRLFELVEGRLSYTYQIITIDNISSNASSIISSLQGDNRVSKVGFSVLRDTRDKIVNTTTGNYLNVLTEVAGGPFGGTDNYYRLEMKASQFFPIFETQAQVLSLIVRGGVIQNFGKSNEVAYYNKYYLGGPTDLRGFEFHTVSPRDEFGEPVGGKTYGFFSAEYSADIVSPIRVAMFYDAGFVNAGAYDFSPVHFADNFGFGLRLFVAGSPLSLDFGIPLTGDSQSKKGNQFNFSFGTRY
jgi:outer membrane protein insertion porin family